MAFINNIEYDDEEELQEAFFSEYQNLLADISNTNILLKGTLLKTEFEKKGRVPDGIIIDFASDKWYVIEVELIKHGVWEHIAPQLVNILVALQSPTTKQKLQDKIIDYLRRDKEKLSQIKQDRELEELDIPSLIDGILESPPVIYIPIDSNKNEDLIDLCKCFNYKTKILQIEKMKNANGEIYYKADRQIMSITPIYSESEIDEKPNQSRKSRYSSFSFNGTNFEFKSYRDMICTIARIIASEHPDEFPEIANKWPAVFSTKSEYKYGDRELTGYLIDGTQIYGKFALNAKMLTQYAFKLIKMFGYSEDSLILNPSEESNE